MRPRTERPERVRNFTHGFEFSAKGDSATTDENPRGVTRRLGYPRSSNGRLWCNAPAAACTVLATDAHAVYASHGLCFCS